MGYNCKQSAVERDTVLRLLVRRPGGFVVVKRTMRSVETQGNVPVTAIILVKFNRQTRLDS